MRVPLLICAAVALVAGPMWSRYYWGYLFSRPPVAATVAGLASVAEISRVECDLATGPTCDIDPDHTFSESINYCERAPYYCLSGRLAVALRDANLLPDWVPDVTADTLHNLEYVVAAAAGRTGGGKLAGILVSGRDPAGKVVYVAGLHGSDAAKHHLPYYELRWSPAPGGEREMRKTVFFYDVGRLEWLGWPVASLLAFVACLAVAAVAAFTRK
jgi:hypothetical protein